MSNGLEFQHEYILFVCLGFLVGFVFFFFFLNFKLIVFQIIIIKFAVQLTCNKHY